MVAEVGQTYDITIEEEQTNEWTGAQGVARLGEVQVRISNAKKGDKFRVEITSTETNPWTQAREARFKVL